MQYKIHSRAFKIEDQFDFACFSGDFNPIHVDPIYSRRTMIGECIVHGVHGFLYALNSLLEFNGCTVNCFEIKFIKPIPLNVLVSCVLVDEDEMQIVGDANNIYTKIKFSIDTKFLRDDLQTMNKTERLPKPLNMTLDECSTFTGSDWAYSGNSIVGENLFPKLFQAYGHSAIVELIGTSEVVGMRCPGLKSLFLSLKGKFSNKDYLPTYRVLECDKRFGILSLIFEGRRLEAEAKVLYLRSQLSNLSISKISQIVTRNEFKDVNALVIGGSRGLGEIVAKLIAYGGGRVVITYDKGEDDAQKVQQEVTEWGGKCRTLQLSVTENFSIPKDNFNQIYYFASSKIKKEDRDFIDQILLDKYDLFYVNGFRNLLNQILKNDLKSNVFYPSTIFLNGNSNGYWAYTEAKARGEQICREFNDKNLLRALYSRLPRLATDQNLGLIQDEFPEAVDILYPIILKMAV